MGASSAGIASGRLGCRPFQCLVPLCFTEVHGEEMILPATLRALLEQTEPTDPRHHLLSPCHHPTQQHPERSPDVRCLP